MSNKDYMSIKEKLRTTDVYICNDPEFVAAQVKCMDLLFELNNTRPSDMDKRNRLMRELFADVGEDLYIELPVRTNWGFNTHWGDGCYANFNLTLTDDNEIFIGDHVMIAPNVVISTAGHPVEPELRYKYGQFAMPIRIGNNVWIGANVVILPGVTIGDNTVIGAGSIVTRDIPANVVAVGNPCRVMREIGERDKEYYYKEMRIPPVVKVIK